MTVYITNNEQYCEPIRIDENEMIKPWRTFITLYFVDDFQFPNSFRTKLKTCSANS